MEHPQATDGILGGQTPPPVSSATLGGIAGLQQRLAIVPPEQRSHLLSTALNYGEAGIDLLIVTLTNDPVLTVRGTAYQLLQSMDSEEAKTAISNGILLNPGDQAYSVYKSAIHFNDSEYCLHPEIQHFDFANEINWEEQGYADYEEFCRSEESQHEYGGGVLESYIPKRVARYISQVEAEAAADQLHQKLVSEWKYTSDFNFKQDFVFNEWCKLNQIQYIGEYEYWNELINELKAAGNYELLGRLWRDSIGDFAFVREETVNESQHLKL
jgi:hypothetical protein